MTYNFQTRGAIRRYGMGDDDDAAVAAIQRVLAAFLPKINEISAASTAQAEAEVEETIRKATGASPTAPAVTTAAGSSSPESVSAADFTIVGPIAKPKNFPALAAAKQLQLQMDRMARLRGFSTIAIDGVPGPATVALAVRLDVSDTLVELLNRMGTVTAALGAAADAAGAPATVSDVRSAATAGAITVFATNGKSLEFKPPGVHASMLDTVKSLPDVTKIVGGAALLLGGALLVRRRLKKNPARRRRSRRRR